MVAWCFLLVYTPPRNPLEQGMTLLGNMVKHSTSPPTNQHWLNHFLGELHQIPPPNWLKGWAMRLYAMISPSHRCHSQPPFVHTVSLTVASPVGSYDTSWTSLDGAHSQTMISGWKCSLSRLAIRNYTTNPLAKNHHLLYFHLKNSIAVELDGHNRQVKTLPWFPN